MASKRSSSERRTVLIDDMSVKELVALVESAGFNHSLCVTKDDLRKRANEAADFLKRNGGPPVRTPRAEWPATAEWTEVPEGASLPFGVETKFNFSSEHGKTYARIPQTARGEFRTNGKRNIRVDYRTHEGTVGELCESLLNEDEQSLFDTFGCVPGHGSISIERHGKRLPMGVSVSTVGIWGQTLDFTFLYNPLSPTEPPPPCDPVGIWGQALDFTYAGPAPMISKLAAPTLGCLPADGAMMCSSCAGVSEVVSECDGVSEDVSESGYLQADGAMMCSCCDGVSEVVSECDGVSEVVSESAGKEDSCSSNELIAAMKAEFKCRDKGIDPSKLKELLDCDAKSAKATSYVLQVRETI